MRQGRAFKRCSKCGARVPERRCAKCGSDVWTWSFVVDVARRGERRQQRTKAGFVSKAAAVDAMNRLQQQKIDGEFVEPSRMTLANYLRSWYQGGELRGWEANTTRDYRNSIERHIVPALGNIPLQALATTHLEAFYAGLLQAGKVTRKRGLEIRGPLSRKMVHNIHICLRAALQDAAESDPPLMRRNPASKAFSYSRGKHRKELPTWTTEQIQAFLRHTANDRELALYRTALMTGMRRGELLGLRRADLSLRFKRLQVRQQWARDGDRGLRIKGLKTDAKAWRTIDLDDGTVEILAGLLAAQDDERDKLSAAYQDRDLVFCRPDGSPYDVDVVTRTFQRRAKAASLPVMPFHGCRHTHATLLLENGESLKYVAERLGDREDTVLETYGHVTSKMRSIAVSRLGALIDGPRFRQQASGWIAASSF